VTRVENDIETAGKLVRTTSATRKATSTLDPSLPQRPGFGTMGNPVVLWTNYFELMSYGELLLNRYSIEVIGVQGARGPKGKRLKRVVQLFLEDHLAHHGRDIVTDFKSNIFSKADLGEETEYTVVYRSEGEDSPPPNAKTYRVRLQPTGAISVSELMDYVTSTNSSQLFGSKEEISQALNILVGYHPKESRSITSIGANKHFPINAAAVQNLDLGAGLTAIRGFFLSVRAATARILVNVQVKHGAFYNSGPLDQLMQAFMSQNGPNKVKLGNFVKKLSVDVIHITKMNRAGERVPRLKVIAGFAMHDDGRGQQHPPIVPEFGAGSKDVKFFLSDSPTQPPEKSEVQTESSKSGKKKKKKAAAKPEPGPSSQGKYISIYDYFMQSKHLNTSILFRNADNSVHNRVSPN
jgi:eukaryotic translation initiation factor 2C